MQFSTFLLHTRMLPLIAKITRKTFLIRVNLWKIPEENKMLFFRHFKINCSSIKSFLTAGLFLYPLKTSEN